MASNNHFTNSRSNLSTNSDAAEAVRNHQQQQSPGVTFARRTSSGRYVNYSRDDLDSELGSVDFTNYTVHIPPTPDNQPMDPSISQKVEEQYVSSSLFTGGFNSVTRAHLMDKVIDSETSHPQMAGAKGSSCAIPGCDVKVMSDGRGQDLLPCECDFKICRDCFVDAVKAGGGMCPGCKEPYRNTDLTDLAEDGQQKQQRPMLPPPSGGSKMERRLSLMKSTKSGLMRSQTGDFDHNRWLFETSGTYGYGNAFWTKDGNLGSEKDGSHEIKAMKQQRQNKEDEIVEPVKIPKATWMADGTHWPGTWLNSAPDHSRSDHAGIIQVMLKPPSDEPLHGVSEGFLDLTDVDIRLPLLVYVSREKRPGYDHNKKAGAMNALVRASAIMSNGPFILNLDCDHYIYNSQALREGMCFMMDRGGDRLCYVQFPQRFEGIDPSDRYANHNTVFFDVNMRALDGLMGPVYVGTGCLFRRIALYGFDPPRSKEHHPGCCSCCFPRKKKKKIPEENRSLRMGGDSDDDEEMNLSLVPKKFGNSTFLIDSIPVAEFQGRPLADHPAVQNGRPPGALTIPRELLDASTVAEAIAVISCWYEDKTEWGTRIGWIYGSVTEDVVTGYRMHNRGWKSVYCVTKRDAFRGTAPINLTDRLHQVLRWATGSVEIFFSRNNAFLASPRMKILQRIAYLNVGIYPFTSIFLIVYCFLPALSLFSGQFIVQTLNVTFLIYLLIISITLCLLALLEIKWSGISLEEWWRNEQFWLIGGTSAHLAAVIQGLLKVVAGIEISFTLTSKSGGEDVDDEFADLYIVKWTSLMIPPITIMMVNLIAIAVGFSRTIYSVIPQWSKLIGGVFFSFWVLAHLYPFAKGLMGRRGKTPTIVYVWSGLIAITISLLWVAVNPPAGSTQIGGSFTFP
ncbi:hypothetical protein BRARA_E03541 [Brassica rapa]|uniref:Cellulose synthase-like protein D3 n=2 Tax=Brassica campestris TaxID=3711 RepID=A0A397ZI19_BRACM|nr:hypothetical protein BRARA_E03541 [Brassica rapa]